MYSRKCTSFLEPVLQSYFLVSGEFLTSISILEGTFLSKAMHSNVKQMASSQYFHKKLYNTWLSLQISGPIFLSGLSKVFKLDFGRTHDLHSPTKFTSEFFAYFFGHIFLPFFLATFYAPFFGKSFGLFPYFFGMALLVFLFFFLAGLSLSFFYFFGKPFFGFFFGLEKY